MSNKEPQLQLPKQNGLLTFIKESSTTIFALAVLGGAGWVIGSINTANLSLAIITTQLTGINTNITELKVKIAEDRTSITAEINDLKKRVLILEQEHNQR
jgi:hypothetical protein